MQYIPNIILLTRSIMSLIGVSKSNVTFLNHKDQYYRCYWLPENLCNGIELISQLERTTKKAAAELLIKAGFSSYMGNKITEQIKLDLRKIVRERGTDISKFI